MSTGTQVKRYPGDDDFKYKIQGKHVFDFGCGVTPEKIKKGFEIFDIEMKNQRIMMGKVAQ